MYKKAYIRIKYAWSSGRIGKMIGVARRTGWEAQRPGPEIKSSRSDRPQQLPAQDRTGRWQVGTGPEATGRRNAPGPRGYDIRRS